MRPSTLLLGSLLLAATARSQTTYKIIPASHENLEGNSLSTYPLKYEDVAWQMLIDKAAIGKTQGLISGISFRPDGSGSTLSYPAKKLNVTIMFYETATTPATMSKTFATNYGSTKGTVVFQGTVSLPATNVGYPLPATFSAKIPFPSLYTYLTSKGNLLIDWVETGVYSSVSWNADAVNISSSTPGGLVNEIWENSSCANARGDQASLSISTSGNGALGGPIAVKYTMKPAASNVLDLMVLGVGASNLQWGAISLPLDLTPAGFASCALAVDLSILIPSTTTPVSLTVPNSSSFNGVPLYFQGLAIDSKAPALVPTSNAYQVLIQPNQLVQGVAQTVYATKPSTRGGVGFASPHFYHPVIRLDGKLFQ